MTRYLLLALLLASSPLRADEAAPGLAFSIIRTAEVSTLEGLTYAGGSFLDSVKLNHMAVLVRHPQGSFLFDSGLGRRIDAQYEADMPWWARPFFTYDEVAPAADQLADAGLPTPPRIILSHAHWDHASGLVDFPTAEVWAPAAELQYMQHEKPPGVLPSQISSPALRWQALDFSGPAYENYPASLDLFDDGSAVLVPLSGHTPGSIGLFLHTASGGRYFFIGDVVWNAAALDPVAPKFAIASWLADHDRAATLDSIRTVAATRARIDGLIVVPAHDKSVHDRLAYFPEWVR